MEQETLTPQDGTEIQETITPEHRAKVRTSFLTRTLISTVGVLGVAAGVHMLGTYADGKANEQEFNKARETRRFDLNDVSHSPRSSAEYVYNKAQNPVKDNK
jgi:hypothetical protein